MLGVVVHGQSGAGALQWVDNFENLGTTSTEVAAVIVNSPFASTTGTVQILTGISNGFGSSNTWEFGADGILTIPDDIQDANGSVVRVATTSTAPTRVNGQLWFNNQEGRLYIKNDGVWIDASPVVVPLPNTYLDEITIDGSTLNINGSTLTISNTGTLLVNGSEVIGSGSGSSTHIEYTDGQSQYTSTVDLGYNFEVDTHYAHLNINGNGDWEIGSNNFDTKIFSTDDPGNEPKVIVVRAGDDDWTFGPLGWFTLPGGSRISDGMGAIRLEPSGASSSTQALLVYPTAQDGNHIHLTAGGGETDLYLGSDSQYVKVDHSGDIVVGTLGANTSTWTFGTDGSTKFPNDTILGTGLDPNVYIETVTTATTSTWTFGTNGILTLPAATPVIKGGGTGTDVTVIASTGSNTSTWVFGADGSFTFPDNTVQTTAYKTGQTTVELSTLTEVMSEGYEITSLEGINVIYFTTASGYTDVATHLGAIPLPEYPGQRVTIINDANSTVTVAWTVLAQSVSITLDNYDSSDLIAITHPKYGGLAWWETNRYNW